MSVTDVKLFSSTHRGTMLPDRDMAVLIQRLRPRANSAQCTIEEIVTPKPSPRKSPSKSFAGPDVLRIDASKPARVPTRVGVASSIPKFTAQTRIPTPKQSPAPRVASRGASRRSSAGSARSFEIESVRGSRRSPARSPPRSPARSPPRSPARSPPRSPLQSPVQSPRPSPQRSSQRSAQRSPEPPRTAPPRQEPAPQAKAPAPQAKAPAPGPVDWRKVFMDVEFRPEDFADIDVEKENATPLTRREKQEVLFQLIKSYPEESQGQWSMKVPLVELK